MKSSARSGRKVRLLALHTTEGIMKNSDLKAFFDRSDTQGSSHASADNSGLMEKGFVPYDRAAWTLRSGNSISDNLEQCGFAKWTRKEWLENRRGTLDAAALWLAKRSIARGIPLRVLTHAQIRAGEAGVIQHNDWTVAMKDGSHWDCGPGYPIDYVVGKAKEIAAELTGKTNVPDTTKRNKDKNMIQVIPVQATPQAGAVQRLIIPTGEQVSMITDRAWFSAAINGPSAGHVKGWFQSDSGGISDFEMWINMVNGVSEREWREIPAGTTQLNLHYKMPDGGCFLLETLAR